MASSRDRGSPTEDDQLGVMSGLHLSKPPRFSLAFSTLAGYFHNLCDLYVFLRASAKRGSQDMRDTDFLAAKPSVLQAAIFAKGNLWEDNLVSWLENDHRGIDGSGMTLIELLTSVPDGAYVHHFRSSVPAGFYRQLPRDLIEFRTFEPDFLLVNVLNDGTREITIIDAKTGHQMKTSYQVQISCYYLALQALIQEASLDCCARLSPRGLVWLPRSPAELYRPDLYVMLEFDIALMVPLLCDFLYERLPAILVTRPDEVAWHYNPVCASCEYTGRCSQAALTTGNLSNVPYLSGPDRRWLQTMIKQHVPHLVGAKPQSDMEDLGQLLSLQSLATSQSNRLRALMACQGGGSPQSACGQSPVLEAYHSRHVAIKGFHSMELPSQEDFALYIVLVIDPISAQPHSFALELRDMQSPEAAGQLVKTTTSLPVTIAGQKSVADQFVCALADMCRRVPSSATLQCYVLDNSTKEDMLRLIVEAVSRTVGSDAEADIQVAALLCFYSLVDNAQALLAPHQPDLMSEERCRAFDAIHTRPVIAVLFAVQGLFVLPVPGFYTLQACLEHLVGEDSEHVPTSAEIFASVLPSASLLCRQQLSVFVKVVLSARNRLRAYCAPLPLTTLLVARARPLPREFPALLQDSNLQRLLFIQQYEALASCAQLQKDRLSGKGATIQLRALSYDTKTHVYKVRCVFG